MNPRKQDTSSHFAGTQVPGRAWYQQPGARKRGETALDAWRRESGMPRKRKNPTRKNPVPKALGSVTNSILAGIGLALGFKLVSSLTDKSSDES